MELKGKIIAALGETTGTSKAGNAWKKSEYVMEYGDGQYPRRMAFTCFGDNADKIKLAVGQTATVYFDIESREWNGKWFTDIRAWRADVEPDQASTAQAPAYQPATSGAPIPPP
ncbi:MAG: DUF3127 domain-containing protein, partial [Muribaculaceae bacterium]|nr:DUF3127 domain-containing protein [Muribaculaceae bacterium]